MMFEHCRERPNVATPEGIPLHDLMRTHAPIRSEFDREIGRVLDSGWLPRGRQVESFEEEWEWGRGRQWG